MLIDEVLKQPGFWTQSGPKRDIVLSTRIRIARNVQSLPFPDNLDESESYIIRHALERFSRESRFAGSVELIDLANYDSHERRLLRERNLITHEMESSSKSMLVLDRKHDFTVLVNEEDHLRIQIIKPGLQLMDAYKLADTVDDELNAYFIYAFSDEYGYLTSCPSNLGTAMRCSVIVHLPVLSMQNRIGEMATFLKDRGVLLKGTTGDTRKTVGGLYQISNKLSLGLSEIDIIEVMDNAINNLISYEDSERDNFASLSRLKLEDMVYRSLGILRYARTISYVEAMEHLANLRLGIVLAVIRDISLDLVNDLMVNVQWSHLQNNMGQVIISNSQCDRMRGEYISDCLNVNEDK